ncbi:MAG: hypothetical protein LBM77_03925 [Spirochaetaceae bacterium]|nr:hypothetical protein [Spirochaetaceae bacterium]
MYVIEYGTELKACDASSSSRAQPGVPAGERGRCGAEGRQACSGAVPPEAAGLTEIKVDYGTVAANGGHKAVVDCRWGAG